MTEQGETGLWYLTNDRVPEIFIAASTKDEAQFRVGQAIAAMAGGPPDVEGHVWHAREDGSKVTVPSPEWMTPQQRAETIDRLLRHLRERMCQ